MKHIALALFLLPLCAFAQPDPIAWDTNGIPIRQGNHMVWMRTAPSDAEGNTLVVWSETRNGAREIYASLVSPTGLPLWDEEIRVAEPNGDVMLQDHDAIATTGGFIVLWASYAFEGEAFADTLWAQKFDYNGAPVWSDNDTYGVIVDSYPDATSELSAHLVSDGQGGAFVAWEDTRDGDVADIYAQHVDEIGVTWPAVIEVCGADDEQLGLQAVNSGPGSMILAWTDRRNADQNIFAAKLNSDGTLPWPAWGICVCCATGSQDQINCVDDGNGGAYFIWRDQRSGSTRDLYAQRLDANGASLWQVDGVPICAAPNDQVSPRIATSYDNGIADGFVAVWEDRRVNGFVEETFAQKMSANGVSQWTADGIRVCGDALPGGQGSWRGNGRIVSDGQGGAFVVWEDTRDHNNYLLADLFGARLNASGIFVWGSGCGLPIASGPRAQFFATMTRNAVGDLKVVWDDTESSSQQLRTATFNGDNGLLVFGPIDLTIQGGIDGDAFTPYLVSMNQGRAVFVWKDFRAGIGRLYYQILDRNGASQLTADGEPVITDESGEFLHQAGFALCPDGSGGCFVAFEDDRDGVKQIRARRITSDGDLAGDPAGNTLWDADRDQILPKCAPDGSGGCFVAWSGFDANYLMSIAVMRVTSSCVPMWNNATILDRGPQDDEIYDILPAADGCIVYWKSGSSSQTNVSAAKIAPDGSMLWDREVCDADLSQTNAVAVADQFGESYFVWMDRRSGVNFEIYAQRIDADGQDVWAYNGVPVCQANNSHSEGWLAIDLSPDRDLLAAWEDFRNGVDLDLYMQRVKPDGSLALANSGVAVVAQPGGNQFKPVLVSGPIGDVHIFWTDSRNEYYDLYGTHLDSLGQSVFSEYWNQGSGGVICNAFHVQSHIAVARDNDFGLFCAWNDQRSSGAEPLISVWSQYIITGFESTDEIPVVPNTFVLEQNYPNPFNPVTSIRFSVPRAGRAELRIFDLLGREVAVLADEVLQAGSYERTFDGTKLGSGIYFCRLIAGSETRTIKMMMLK